MVGRNVFAAIIVAFMTTGRIRHLWMPTSSYESVDLVKCRQLCRRLSLYKCTTCSRVTVPGVDEALLEFAETTVKEGDELYARDALRHLEGYVLHSVNSGALVNSSLSLLYSRFRLANPTSAVAGAVGGAGHYPATNARRTVPFNAAAHSVSILQAARGYVEC